jgi:hypothetical protein
VGKFLYKTSYCETYDQKPFKECISTTSFPPEKPKVFHGDYELSKRDFVQKPLEFEKRQVYTSLLYRAKTTGITSRKLVNSKMEDGTTYRYAYRDMSVYIPTTPPPKSGPIPFKKNTEF